MLRFRVLRTQCRITSREIAEAVNISISRLSQIETGYYGSNLRDKERLIQALETAVAREKKAIKKAEYIIKHKRETIFDYVKGGDKL